jgi:hypothetical protein
VGGSNPLKAAATLPRTYKSDTVDNYEIGAKTEWLDHRFRFNIAGYYMKWDNFQVQVEDPKPSIFNLGYVNFPSADIKGFESDFAVAITDQLKLEGTLAYNDAKISRPPSWTQDPPDGIVYEITGRKEPSAADARLVRVARIEYRLRNACWAPNLRALRLRLCRRIRQFVRRRTRRRVLRRSSPHTTPERALAWICVLVRGAVRGQSGMSAA